jgi:hypothetical protein
MTSLQYTKHLGRGLILSAALGLLFTAAGTHESFARQKAATTPAEAATAAEVTDMSAARRYKRRHVHRAIRGRRAGAMMFGIMAGTIANIAAAEARREQGYYYEPDYPVTYEYGYPANTYYDDNYYYDYSYGSPYYEYESYPIYYGAYPGPVYGGFPGFRHHRGQRPHMRPPHVGDGGGMRQIVNPAMRPAMRSGPAYVRQGPPMRQFGGGPIGGGGRVMGGAPGGGGAGVNHHR